MAKQSLQGPRRERRCRDSAAAARRSAVAVSIFVDTPVVCIFSSMKRSDIILCVQIHDPDSYESDILVFETKHFIVFFAIIRVSLHYF